jgi:myo-inositol-1(or 4)-monophosphatase
MSGTELAERLEAAARTARVAGALALDHFRNRDRLVVDRKGRQDLVSRADRDTEALIRRELEAAFPGEAYLGEEGGGVEAERLWVIDPIDGTLNFLRGLPCWAVVIAWVERGRTLLGVTYDPVHDELYAACRGAGASLNGRPIRVSPTERTDEALVALTFNFRQPAEPYLRLIDGLIAHGCEHRRMGSTAMALCHVADGRCDAMATLSCSSWDVLAGLLTAEEAGGVASDFVASHGLLGHGGVMASTPALAAAVGEASGLGAG